MAEQQKVTARQAKLAGIEGKIQVMKSTQTAVPVSLMRGGTSRAAYFRAEDLPADTDRRNRVLLAVMGGPDDLRVDGIGGGHPLTNKVAVIGRSDRPDADVDYLFLQVHTADQRVSGGQNCGNILAGVGPFAIERGFVAIEGETTRVRVHMRNSGDLAELIVETPDGAVNYDGDAEVDGVPGAAAPVVCDFLDVAGSMSGALLPSGNATDAIDGVGVTCIDNGMPVVLLSAADLSVSGYETADDLDAMDGLKARLESLRRVAGPLMNLGDVADKTVPKMCLVAAARDGGAISTRMFIPHLCHRSIGVLGAVTVATACLVPGSVPANVARVPDGVEKTLRIEHPSGSLPVRLVAATGSEKIVQRAGVIRTARMIMQGSVFVPTTVWGGLLREGDKRLRKIS